MKKIRFYYLYELVIRMVFLRFLFSISFYKHLFYIVFSTALLFILVSLGLNFYTNHNIYQNVPDFEGIEISALAEIIDNENLRFEVIDSSRFDPRRPPLTIISQLSAAGSEVKEKRKIYLTVNPSGFRMASVPNLIQITKRNAVSIIKSSGFLTGEYIYIDNIGKDMVLEIRFEGEKILPGDLLSKASKIDLVLGNGKQ